MDDMKSFVVSAILVALFVFAIIGFSISISEKNDSVNPIQQDPALNKSYSQIQQQLNESQQEAEGSSNLFFEDIPVLGTVELFLGSIFKVAKTVTSSIRSVFSISFGLIQTTLGIPPIITGSLMAIIIISTIFLAWKLYKTGS